MTLEPGVVIRVRDWPGTSGERYVVQEIRTVPSSPWPKQVDAWRIDKHSHGGFGLAALRTFPAEKCEVDARRTKAMEAHNRRVRARLTRGSEDGND